MPFFGIKAPDSAADIAALADFCRHNGLRFIADLDCGLERVSSADCVYLPEGEHRGMEKILDACSMEQPVILLPQSAESLPAFAMWVNNWLNRKSGGDELWDVYDKDRQPVGRLHRRGDEMADGDYHLTVHVWLRDSQGRYLLTKRSPNKGYGGMWESPGGSAQAGDDSLTASLREYREETGIELDPSKGRMVLSFSGGHFFCDVWLFKQDFDIDSVVLLPGETCDKRLATKEEILQLHEQGEFVPFQYIEQILNAE